MEPEKNSDEDEPLIPNQHFTLAKTTKSTPRKKKPLREKNTDEIIDVVNIENTPPTSTGASPNSLLGAPKQVKTKRRIRCTYKIRSPKQMFTRQVIPAEKTPDRPPRLKRTLIASDENVPPPPTPIPSPKPQKPVVTIPPSPKQPQQPVPIVQQPPPTIPPPPIRRPLPNIQPRPHSELVAALLLPTQNINVPTVPLPLNMRAPPPNIRNSRPTVIRWAGSEPCITASPVSIPNNPNPNPNPPRAPIKNTDCQTCGRRISKCFHFSISDHAEMILFFQFSIKLICGMIKPTSSIFFLIIALSAVFV